MVQEAMERSNVYLNPTDKRRLKEIATAQGIQYSQALRIAIKLYIQYHENLLEKK